MSHPTANSETPKRPPSRLIRFLAFMGVVAVLGGFAIADSIGLFNTKPYTEITHGSHIHYVPLDRDPDVSLSRFPTTPPGPDEIITPTGIVIKRNATPPTGNPDLRGDQEQARDRNPSGGQSRDQTDSQPQPQAQGQTPS